MERSRLLFIGNSHTYFNDLPAMVAGMIEAVAAGSPGCMPVMLTQGGKGWDFHLENKQTAFNIRHGGYQAVVLQQVRGGYPGEEATLRDGAALIEMVRAAGARPILFMPWPHRDRPEAFAPFRACHERLAREQEIPLAPAGTAWARLWADDATLPLYDADCSHAAPAGSYLAACAIFAALYRSGGLPSLGVSVAAGHAGAAGATSEPSAHAPLPPRRLEHAGRELIDLPESLAAKLGAAAWRAVADWNDGKVGA